LASGAGSGSTDREAVGATSGARPPASSGGTRIADPTVFSRNHPPRPRKQGKKR
jgi:hypothetical protein